MIRVAHAGQALYVVGLDTAAARHPIAGRTLVALGVLELHDAGGTRILTGGPAEAVLREAREAVAAAGSPALDAARRGGRSSRHRPTPIPARWSRHGTATLLAARTGRPSKPVSISAGRLAVADATGVRAPLLAHAVRLLPLLAVVGHRGRPAPGGGREPVRLGSAPRAAGYLEPLTDQERAVLGFLPTLMSNREIAGAMHLSVNTVKTHVKALYRKLAVDSRRNAVVRARQLELF